MGEDRLEPNRYADTRLHFRDGELLLQMTHIVQYQGAHFLHAHIRLAIRSTSDSNMEGGRVKEKIPREGEGGAVNGEEPLRWREEGEATIHGDTSITLHQFS